MASHRDDSIQKTFPKAEKLIKLMSQLNLKNHIHSWVKSNQTIDSPLGEIIIGKQIGEGGNALVFESPFVGGTAIKFLSESVSSPPSTRYARFLDEYRNLIKLVPTAAIVPLYHLGIQEMEGKMIPYVVMELCVKTLYDTYKSSKLASASEFQLLLDRLLEALDVVHAAGIVHRDIKPQNILLRKNHIWVLGDFGIAWFDPELHTKLAISEKNERLANFEFSAPEQVTRQAYDKPTPSMDLYALGQTLYFCVTGHTIKGSGYPHFGQFVPELSRYEALIDRLVRQIPQERLQSVNEIYQFLEEENDNGHYLDRWRTEEQIRVKFQRQLDVFDLALRSAMPGAYEYVQAKGKNEIDRVISSLASYRENCDLWWFRGYSNNPVRALEKLSSDIWLID
jgi:serine/threonine protein kinase